MVQSQPYVYDSPKRYSQADPYGGFDPKAFTRASQEPRSYPRGTMSSRQSGQQGPLLNFNKHPDSWGSNTYTPQYPTEPMPASTKTKVKVLRGLQLFLRIVEFLAAVGVMFCVIVIKNTADTEGIVIRVPASVDLLASLYAIVHLCRAAKSRAPGSSASYHFFAMLVDVVLVPFYVYIALASRHNLTEPKSDKERWTTFFSSSVVTEDVFKASGIVCVTAAGLHVASCLVSGYLFVLFRRILNLPPDLNPLEDNLTSRRKSKHQHKNSEATAEKHASTFSLGSTVWTGTDSGRSSPNKGNAMESVRPVPFLHTRQDSGPVYSPHNPNTASASRTDLARFQQADGHTFNTTFSNSSATLTDVASNKSHTLWSQPSSHLPTISSLRSQPKYAEVPPLPRKSSKREGPATHSENWTLQDEDRPKTGVSIVEEEEPNGAMTTLSHFGLDAFRKNAYQPLHQNSSSHSLARSVGPASYQNLQPLRMNPPTPVASIRNGVSKPASPVPRPLSATSGNSISSPKRKSKGYGLLPSKTAPTPERDSGYSEAEWIKPARSSPYAGVDKRDFANDGQGRVVSRSGADIADAGLYRHDVYEDGDDGFDRSSLQPGWGGNGLRKVSGKVAEEGLAGHGSWWRRRTSGTAGR